MLLPEIGSWAGLGRPLRVSCATTVPREFLVAHVFVPCFRARFCQASYSYSVYTNMCLRVRASSYYQNIYLPRFTYLHIVYPCACLCI